MVFQSNYSEVKPPAEYGESLSAFFWHQLDRFADRTLFVDHKSSRTWTGLQTKESTRRIAAHLMGEFSIKPNDSIVFFYPNSDYVILAALGSLFAGASVCVGAAEDPPRERAYMVNTMKPSMVFAQAKLADELRQLRANSNGALKFKLCLIEEKPESGNVAGATKSDSCPAKSSDVSPDEFDFHAYLLDREPLTKPEALCIPAKLRSPEDPAFVLLTSGSTGHPKPVGRSHRNSLNVCFSFDSTNRELWDLNETSVLAGHLPLDHGTGIFSIKMTMSKGLKLVLMENYFEDLMLEAIERHAITDIMLGSALLNNFIQRQLSCADPKERANLESVRNFIAIGSPIASRQLVHDFMDQHPNCSVRQAFGATECGFISVVARAEARDDVFSVGWLLPTVQIKIVDVETGEQILEREKEGELFVKGPTVSPGYLGSEFADQSRKVFLDDGFYRTFDLCKFDHLGRLCIRGRLNDVLCLGDGWKVLPSEIERILCEHPGIAEAAVIGIPHPELPTCHAPRAYVRLAPDWEGKLDEKGVVEYAFNNMSEPKHLVGGVRIMKDLPRISIGKVDKKALRQMDGY